MKHIARALLSILIVLVLICGFVLCGSAEGEDVEQPPEEEKAVQEEIAVTEEIGIARWESLLIALLPSAGTAIGAIAVALCIIKKFNNLLHAVIDETTIAEIKKENKRLQSMMRTVTESRSEDQKSVREIKQLLEAQNRKICDIYKMWRGSNDSEI